MQTSPMGPSSKGQVKEGDIGQSSGDLGSDDFSKGQNHGGISRKMLLT
jgi:hypothetical protein